MEINPNRNVDPALLPGGPSQSRSASRAANVYSFDQSAGLDAALEAVPDSRANLVNRAERLVSATSYPPREVIQRIANLLAANLIMDPV